MRKWTVWRTEPWNIPVLDPWLTNGWNRRTNGVCDDDVWVGTKRKRRFGVYYGGSCRDHVHLVSMVA